MLRSLPGRALLLSSTLPLMALASEGDAPRPFQALAHLAPPVSNDTYGVLTVSEGTWTFDDCTDCGYVIDGVWLPPEPGTSMASLWHRSIVKEAWFQAPTWVPPAGRMLFMNAGPQSVWRLPTAYEP